MDYYIAAVHKVYAALDELLAEDEVEMARRRTETSAPAH
jgi:hypothetical protein